MVGDTAELGVYYKLVSWGAWATDRHEIFERHDDVAGDFRLTRRIRELILETRRQHYPPQCEAIERTVASMRREHDLVMLEYMLRQYFIEWKTVETIAIDEDRSQFEITEYLQRALREVARRLPTFERRASPA